MQTYNGEYYAKLIEGFAFEKKMLTRLPVSTDGNNHDDKSKYGY